MVLRFPIERARIAPADFFADDQEAKVLILPTVRIERGESEKDSAAAAAAIGDQSPEPNSMGGRRRRRTPRS